MLQISSRTAKTWVREERIPARGLQPIGHSSNGNTPACQRGTNPRQGSTTKQRFRYPPHPNHVREERIPARGLQLNSDLGGWVGVGESERNESPPGVYNFKEVAATLLIPDCQRGTNPRQGSTTLEYNVEHCSNCIVREERIPARGLQHDLGCGCSRGSRRCGSEK